MAIHPTRAGVMVVVDRIDTPRFSCSVSMSRNGGVTWRPLPLPLAAGESNCFVPDVDYAGNGDLLVLYAPTGGRYHHPTALWLQRFTDTSPVGPPLQIAGLHAFHGRMAVDRNAVAVTWVQVGAAMADKPLGFTPAPNPVMLRRSTDGGRSFSDPAPVSEPARLAVQPTPVLLPGGDVLVGALDLGDDVDNYEGRHEGYGGPPGDGRWGIVAWRVPAGAGGRAATVVAGGLVIPERVIVDIAPAPSFVREDGSGAVWAAWDSGRGHGRDIFVSVSRDDGRSWSNPRRIRRAGEQFVPAIGLSPAGRVDVVFYERAQPAHRSRTTVVMAVSWDGGGEWHHGVVSGRAFDGRIGFGAAQGMPNLGHQLAVVSRVDDAVAFWSDTRKGTVDDNVQDLATTTVALHEPGGGGPPYALVGGALVAGGAVLGLFAGRRRERRAAPATVS